MRSLLATVARLLALALGLALPAHAQTPLASPTPIANPTPAGLNPIVNGSFETGTLFGWTITGDVVASTSAGATEGIYSAVFQSSAATDILSQSFATVPRQSYFLDFDFRSLISQQFITFDFNGDVFLSDNVQVFSDSYLSASAPFWGSSSGRISIDATHSTTTVRFLGAQVAIDNVSVRAATSVLPTNKCDAAKMQCANKKQACLLKLHGMAENKGARPNAAKLQKCSDKFDGGTKGFAKGCIGKLETKQDPEKPKTICSVTGDVVALEGKVDAFVIDVVSEIDPGFSTVGPPNKCNAGKKECVWKKASCLLKEYSRAEKQGEPPNAAKLQKCSEKFDGGTKGFAKGCIGKLETKQDPEKPKTICSVTGDVVGLEGKVDAFVIDVVSEIQNTP